MLKEFARKIKLSLRYYRSIAPFNILLTLACAYLFYANSPSNIIPSLVFFKLLVLGISCYFTKLLRSKELYYYRNLEISMKMLWTVAFIADLLIFTLVLILTNYLFL